MIAIINGKIFNGIGFYEGKALNIDGNKILNTINTEELSIK